MKRIVLTFVLLHLLVAAGIAQKPRTVVAAGATRSKLVDGKFQRLRTFELESKLLARKTWFKVILPENYDEQSHSGRAFPVLYLLHGLSGRFDNWTKLTAVETYSKPLDLIIVMPDGGDGWYTDSVTVPNDRYESFIVKELITEIDNSFRTIAERRGRAIAGLSMGGYGSIKIGLKYPELFSLAGSFSGALDAPLRGQVHKNWRPSIMSVFGPDDSPIRKASDVFALVNSLSPENLRSLPFFYISCGTEDAVNFRQNFDFASLLVEKKIAHEYRHFPGTHSWKVWDREISEFLEVAARTLGAFGTGEK